MDAFEEDRLSGIKGVDQNFLQKRDELVFDSSQKNNTPITFMLGGGYVKYTDSEKKILQREEIEKNRTKLSDLHLNTIQIASSYTSI